MSNEQQRAALFDRLEQLLATQSPDAKARALEQLLHQELAELAQEDDPSRKVIKAKIIADGLHGFTPEMLDYDND